MSYWNFKYTPKGPDYKVDWPAIRDEFEWVRAMIGVQQEPEFHGEGDVEVHTRMVCESLAADPLWQGLSNPAPTMIMDLIFAGALLHDVAKPDCSKFEDGRWVSPKHSPIGEKMARGLLWQGKAGAVPPFRLREYICKLVRHHGLPLRYLDKDEIDRAIIEASLECDLYALPLVTTADMKGRITKQQQELLDKVALFREYADELGCMCGPKQFESDHHRFMYCVVKKPYEYVPYDDTKGEVTLVCGLPGSGKSTWVKKNAEDRPVICLDELRNQMGVDWEDADQSPVVNAAHEQAKQYLRAGQPFIWDATNITRDMRSALVALFFNYGFRTNLVYVEAPWQVMFERNAARQRPVPAKVIVKMAERLEVPTIREAHKVTYVTE